LEFEESVHEGPPEKERGSVRDYPPPVNSSEFLVSFGKDIILEK